MFEPLTVPILVRMLPETFALVSASRTPLMLVTMIARVAHLGTLTAGENSASPQPPKFVPAGIRTGAAFVHGEPTKICCSWRGRASLRRSMM